MSDNNTEKKTLKLKSVAKKNADVAALGSDVSETSGGMPVMATMETTQVVDNSAYTAPAIVAVVAAVVFVVMVVLQLLELQYYNIPTLLQ